MSLTAEEEQPHYRDAAKVIIAMSSICLVASLAILVGCFTARPASKSRWSMASWIFLGIAATVGEEDFDTRRLRRFEWPATIFPVIFLIFEILACRIAWYSITRPIDQANTWRKSMSTFEVLDMLTGLATLAMFLWLIHTWTLYTGLCGRYFGCRTSAQVALAGDDSWSTMYFDPIIIFHAVLVIAAGFTAVKMLPRSALARAMRRIVAPTLALQIALCIVSFIVTYPNYEGGRPPWVTYYATLPYTFVRVGVIGVLQYVLRVYPANVDDEVADAERAFSLPTLTNQNDTTNKTT
ncbi:hypothetical protein BKA62DRAFT_707980 [Auriculariales sp. MPI-PUGE-AT-0066]|nr:hypothetical protein BKA62DRAFT_707980 [Auriculariales sp. MPI-PUGE-AT-0066]